jgi:signal transduction histidine kinase
VLSELMLAFNLASQRVKFDSDPEQSEAPVHAANDALSEFLRFGRDGTLATDPPGELYCWLDQQVGREISLAARAAVAQGRIAMFETKQFAGNDRMRLIVCPFHDGGGIVALRDVQHLVDARERAFQRRKLESVGQVASGLAHEVNSFLQPILLLAQLTKDDHPDDAELVEAMAVILESTRRAAEIVHGMLLYVRSAPAKLTLLCLPDVVSRDVGTLRRSLPPQIRLELHTGGLSVWIAAHLGELNQIIKNLVDNAVHALGGAGEVRIVVDCVTVTEVSAVRLQIPSGRYARMAISDDGPGIPPALLERIFEPFFTTKAIGEGTGLGLSIVHGIVRSWGGNIIARNVADSGAAFEVMLPLLDAPVEDRGSAASGAVSDAR